MLRSGSAMPMLRPFSTREMILDLLVYVVGCAVVASYCTWLLTRTVSPEHGQALLRKILTVLLFLLLLFYFPMLVQTMHDLGFKGY